MGICKEREAARKVKRAKRANVQELKHMKSTQFFGKTDFAALSEFMKWYEPVHKDISLSALTISLLESEMKTPNYVTAYYEEL